MTDPTPTTTNNAAEIIAKRRFALVDADTLADLLHILDLEWGHLGPPQQGSHRWELSHALKVPDAEHVHLARQPDGTITATPMRAAYQSVAWSSNVTPEPHPRATWVDEVPHD